MVGSHNIRRPSAEAEALERLRQDSLILWSHSCCGRSHKALSMIEPHQLQRVLLEGYHVRHCGWLAWWCWAFVGGSPWSRIMERVYIWRKQWNSKKVVWFCGSAALISALMSAIYGCFRCVPKHAVRASWVPADESSAGVIRSGRL